MFHSLVNHNPDIARLVQKGYAISFDTNCLIVRDVPYLDSNGEVQQGAIVTKMIFVNESTVVQEDHQIFFAGGVPYGLDANRIPNLAGGEIRFPLSTDEVVVQRSFSNKPISTGVFPDFFEKIESYIGIISAPAMAKHGVTPLTYRMVDSSQEQSVFTFQDTLTSRAGTRDLMPVFADEVVAIIGLGGTGSYLLDYIVKTPVKAIRAFDPDDYHVHNAYRSPGRLLHEEFGKSKVDVFSERYDNFRHGLTFKKQFVDQSCGKDFEDVTFAFVCVDKGSARSGIVELLISMNIPFIDVGMGMSRAAHKLKGMLRVTCFPSQRGEDILNRGLVDVHDRPDDLYSTNIQISELNALNASIAMIRYKQLRGFYSDECDASQIQINVSDLRLAVMTS